jgi:tripartite-type tricarboxylate transporter receptor subunit TctC
MSPLKAEAAWARHGTKTNHAVVLYELLGDEWNVKYQHVPIEHAVHLVQTVLGGVVIKTEEYPF